MSTEMRRLTENALIAFLGAQKTYPVEITPINEDGSISFEAKGENIDKAIQAYFANAPVCIQDFLHSYKLIKNTIRSMREAHRG